MMLTDADKKLIADWIQDKCGQIRCTLCGKGQWELVALSTLPIGFDLHSTRFHFHQGVPQVSVACTFCGHMIFFNTTVMGFKPDEPPQEQIEAVADEK